MKHVNDKIPNIIKDSGKFYLYTCYICEPKFGVDNQLDFISLGRCSTCGWDYKSAYEGDPYKADPS